MSRKIDANRQVITPRCRIVQGGDLEAFDEAVARVRREYEACVKGRGPGDKANYHLVLQIEKEPDA